MCSSSNKNTSRTLTGLGDSVFRTCERGQDHRMTISYGFLEILFGQVPTAVQPDQRRKCYKHAHAIRWGKLGRRSSSRTEDNRQKSVMRCCVNQAALPQLSTASLCSVRAACWATVLFSWLRSFDMTSRKARLCTSLWRSSVKQKQEGYFPAGLLWAQLLFVCF